MKETQLVMGMPITVELVDEQATPDHTKQVFDYFQYVDTTFSTYKPTSQISLLNAGQLSLEQCNPDVQLVMALAATTQQETNGYFDIRKPDGSCDPSGLVKGWAIYQAAQIVWQAGLQNFCIEAGGDIQTSGHSSSGQAWQVGIRNPFSSAAGRAEVVKVVQLKHNYGMATSGTYLRGQHIYNPHQPNQPITEIVSLSVIGPTVYEADRFATAAFAMGPAGIHFIDQAHPELAAYMIDATGTATMTKNFEQCIA